MRLVLGSLLLAVMFGCGLEVSESPDAVGTAQQALVDLKTPTPWVTWKGSLVPPGTKNAYLVVVQHPADPAKYLAWGFQVNTTSGNTPLFFVVGSRRTELSPMIQDFMNDAAYVSAFDPGFTWGEGTHIGTRPGPTPPPTGTDMTSYSRAASGQASVIFNAVNHF